MSKPVLEAIERGKLGKNFAYKSRVSGYVPAVLYDDMQNKFLNVDQKQTLEILKNHGDNAVVGIRMGADTTTAVIKEVQRDPVSKELLHIDFKPIDASEKITAKVPISFINSDNVIKQRGVIQTQKKNINIECSAEFIPKSINVDASKYNVGQTVKVKDIEIAGEISILDNPEDTIATFIKSTNIIE